MRRLSVEPPTDCNVTLDQNNSLSSALRRDLPSEGKLPRYSEMHPAIVKALPGVVMVLTIFNGQGGFTAGDVNEL